MCQLVVYMHWQQCDNITAHADQDKPESALTHYMVDADYSSL